MNNLLGPFSWSTLPVFFHSGNSSGIWNQEALSEIGRYSMVTFEKAHANMNRKGRQEHILPGECARVKKAATNSTTVAMYYLNSVFDWPFYELHDLMLENPKWRLKDTDGKDITITGKPDGAWCFNLSIPELRQGVKLLVGVKMSRYDRTICINTRARKAEQNHGGQPTSPPRRHPS